jgi:hypothetical protein
VELEEDEPLRSQAIQRLMLLAIHMDTVVKLAFVGASLPWRMQRQTERGSPQLLLVQFEGLDQSVARLMKMLES